MTSNKLQLTLDDEHDQAKQQQQQQTKPCATPRGFREISLQITPSTWKTDLTKCNVCGKDKNLSYCADALRSRRGFSLTGIFSSRTNRLVLRCCGSREIARWLRPVLRTLFDIDIERLSQTDCSCHAIQWLSQASPPQK